MFCAAQLALSMLPIAGPTPLTTGLLVDGLDKPVWVTHAPGDGTRLFVLEQHAGLVRIVDLESATLLPEPFLEVGPLTLGQEQGLLGLAFHPDYATTGWFFVNYTDGAGDTNVVRYTVCDSDSNCADPESAHTILTIDQPDGNHNGGWIDFDPAGLLCIATGDGGGANDQDNHAQTIEGDLLGKILRIDVDGADDFPGDGNRNYAIPPENPFVGIAGDDEIWIYGARNPWRCAFDSVTGDFYIADVGQDAWEEVNVIEAGIPGPVNLGWRCMEGNSCTGLSGCACDDVTLHAPVHSYSHDSGCSITGGAVYHGCAVPELAGTYFFADFCDPRIWSFRYVDGAVTEFTDRTSELNGDLSVLFMSSFGTDANGELYVCDLYGGEVFRIGPECETDLDGGWQTGFSDLLQLLAAWGPCGGACAEDIDGDGSVGFGDLVRLLAAWGPCVCG